MKYNLSNPIDLSKFKNKYHKVIAKGCLVELKEVRSTRTTRQNSALHLYFTMISEELNELGMTFRYFGLKGQELECMYTPRIVKEHFWRPLQITLFDIESTTKINTLQINNIIDIITKFFADRGVVLEFPSFESLINNK